MQPQTETRCLHCGQNKLFARASVPMQEMQSIFDPETALIKGTAFPELSIPYKEGRT